MYRSPQLARIAASIGMLIIHSRPYQPEGRGKIERCFRTVCEQFIANLDPKRLLSLGELNERLQAWVDDYHRSEHSALATTPLLRWQRDIEQVRQLPPATDLRRLFFHRLDRLVRRDSTFLLHNRLYEAPPQPLLRRTLSLQMHEPLRQRIAVHYHLEGLSREELDAYLAHQLKAAGVTQPLFDETARQALYQATKGILRKVNKLALTALQLAAANKAQVVGESILLDATSEALL
jgi:hypothetical protein